MKHVISLLLIGVFLIGLSGCTRFGEVFDVSYEPNGGVFHETSVHVDRVTGGETIPQPIVTREGYVLIGWYRDEALLTPFDFTEQIHDDLTIYAKWDMVEYIVTYHHMEEPYTEIYHIGDTLNLPVNPTRPHLDFESWYKDKDFTEPVDSTYLVDYDMDIYAKWIAHRYTVTFHGPDGVLYTEEYYTNATVPMPDTYELDDLEYMGAYLDPSFTLPIQSVVVGSYDLDVFLRFRDPTDVNLVMYFGPARPADEMRMLTQNLDDVLLAAMDILGYPLGSLEVRIGTTNDGVGEALLQGIADIAFMSGLTYVEYKDISNSPIELLLGATWPYLSKDFTNPADWNDGLATTPDETFTPPYSRSIIVAGPTTEGQAVSDIINSGGTLTWDDVKDVTWCVLEPSSNHGYIFPNLWLQENFGHDMQDITVVYQTSGMDASINNLMNGICDIAPIMADARMAFADGWTTTTGLTIWEDTNVIGVTTPIMNDVLAVNQDNLTTGQIEALQEAFIALMATNGGRAAFALYYYDGFVIVEDEDYDAYRTVLSNMN